MSSKAHLKLAQNNSVYNKISVRWNKMKKIPINSRFTYTLKFTHLPHFDKGI